jgi:hypothetical protein
MIVYVRKGCQKMLANPADFVARMLDIKADAVTEEQWGKVRTLAADPDFTYDRQAGCSLVGAAITAWILALLSVAPKVGE